MDSVYFLPKVDRRPPGAELAHWASLSAKTRVRHLMEGQLLETDIGGLYTLSRHRRAAEQISFEAAVILDVRSETLDTGNQLLR